jgi:choice-of-anchor A domain-containing protein
MPTILARRATRSLSPRTSRLNFETLEGREVPASGLGVASDYSAFILGNFNGQYSDIQGRLAVGGNATITGYSVGTGLTDSDGTRDDVIVGGNIDYTNGQVFNGNVVYGGTGHFEWFGIPNGTTRQGTVIDFAKAKTDLQTMSTTWSGLKTTGTISNKWGIVTLTGNKAGTNIFNLKASDLWNANTVYIKAPAGSTVLVNVSGAEARMQYLGMMLQGGVKAENVVFNFADATKVTLQGIGFQGSVMAPRATVQFDNGNIEGNLIANCWNGYGEIHYREPELNIPTPCGCVPQQSPGSNVSGLVWFDKDNDGTRDLDEKALANVKLVLTGTNSSGQAVTVYATTDATGLYRFTGLKPGNYSIKVIPPQGYKAGKSSVGAFGGTTGSNMTTGITIPDWKESGGYNFGQILC